MKNNIKIYVMQILSIISLNLAYPIIANHFYYMGFTLQYNTMKIVFGSLFLVLFLTLIFFIKDEFILAIWNFAFIYLLGGEVIYFQYATFTNITQIFSISLFLFLLVIISRVNIKFPPPSHIQHSRKYLTALSIVMFIPFLLYLKNIDLSNLLLIDVYETRAIYREINIPLLGYLMGPLVRILLPYLIVINLEERKLKQSTFFIVMLLYVYLTGALKSVFFGLIALLLFYKGDYYSKIKRISLGLSGFTFLGVLFYYFTNSIYFLNIFIRRVFFVPPHLNTVYNNFFKNNFTELSHSPFGLSLSYKNFPGALSRYVGEFVMEKPGLNANVGVFTEGYISFGFLGLIIFAVIITLIILYLKMCKIDKKFFGIIMVYIYYLNTAFLSTLLLTHGMMFLLLFSYYFLRGET